MLMTKYIVTYNEQQIEFELYRKNVKNVNLNVRPDMTVIVSASEQVPLDFIKKFVKEKAPWILKNIRYFKGAQPDNDIKREYVSGETYKYLGRQYRLKVFESNEEKVKYYRGYIYLYVKNKNNYVRKEKLLEKWFRDRAKRVFNESLDKVYSMIKKYQIKKPKLTIRVMKARWGSCIKDKNEIILNHDLIKAPKYCIDYVVLHELIHFKYANHDNNFYDFLSVLMPDWEKRKEILDEEIVRDL